MGFLKLLNIGLILAVRTIPCISRSREIIERLPNNTIPVHYNINLTPYLKEGNFTFYGESNVNIEIHYASSKISLHSRKLKINKTATTLINDNGTIYKPIEHIYNITTNILTLNFNDMLSPGLYILNMKFAGNLSKRSQKQGFMKFRYTTYKGNTKWLAVTHFEPNGAKRMFPCWDEPALKATFNISVLHYQNYSVLSNMPIQKQFLVKQKDMIHTHFKTTPIMSTYIVAIVMSDFIKVPNANNTINMWCKSLTTKVTLAHNIAEKVVKFLIQYTNSSQKVPKMDHVLIPNFVVDGMGNWGLITYDEAKIIYDDSSNSTYQKTKVALTVAHKLAHQWFGNLVTPSWWPYLWLSKGLASFFQTYIINEIFENYRRTTELFMIQKIQQCLFQDTGSLNFVTMKLGSTLEDNFFKLNSLVYEKASILLRMLQNTVTDEVFRKGLITYLTKHQFNSATPDDLWSAIQSALDESDVPHEDYRIKEVMDTWMNQKHYPFVHVKRNYKTGEVTISQTCVWLYGETENKITKWWIPITFATQSNPDFSNTVPRYWLRPDQHNISFTINPNDWIIVNLQLTGYYRVSYDIKNWQKIAHYLNSNKYTNIHVLNRAQIIIDSFILVLNDRMIGYSFLQLIRYLSKDRDYVAWQPLFEIMERMPKALLPPEMIHIKLRFKHLFNELLEYVKYVENPNDDDITKLTRINALKCACNLGNEKCKEVTALKLSKHLANPKTYKISQKEKFMYCTGMMAANRTTWDKMFKLYLINKKIKSKRMNLLEGLSCAEDPNIIINYLNISALNTSLFHNNAHSFIFKYILKKHARNDVILDYILKNFMIILPRSFTTHTVIKFILDNIYSYEQIDKIKRFSETTFNHSPLILSEIKELIYKKRISYEIDMNNKFTSEKKI